MLTTATSVSRLLATGAPIAAVVLLEDLEFLHALEGRLEAADADAALREAAQSGMVD